MTLYERPDADGPPAGHTLFVPSLLISSRTAKLDSEGNPNAHVIVEELKKRGVTINPDAASKTN